MIIQYNNIKIQTIKTKLLKFKNSNLDNKTSKHCKQHIETTPKRFGTTQETYHLLHYFLKYFFNTFFEFSHFRNILYYGENDIPCLN